MSRGKSADFWYPPTPGRMLAIGIGIGIDVGTAYAVASLSCTLAVLLAVRSRSCGAAGGSNQHARRRLPSPGAALPGDT